MMAGGYGQPATQPTNPVREMPHGLNPRLALVRDNLHELEKSLSELRQRMGILSPPQNAAIEKVAEPNSTASMTMDLIASSSRLLDSVREIMHEVS